MHESEKWKGSRSVLSNSYRPHGLRPTRFLRPGDFPGKSTGVGCHCLTYFFFSLRDYGHVGFLESHTVSWSAFHRFAMKSQLFLWKLRTHQRKRKRVGQQIMFKRKDLACRIWSFDYLVLSTCDGLLFYRTQFWLVDFSVHSVLLFSDILQYPHCLSHHHA